MLTTQCVPSLGQASLLALTALISSPHHNPPRATAPFPAPQVPGTVTRRSCSVFLTRTNLACNMTCKRPRSNNSHSRQAP
jgi:hypothetical protein